jgi:uncharacterized damage-inducible protein DinB
MQPATVRGWQLDQLRKGLQTVRHILTNVSAEDATSYRDGGTGWTVLEVLCHLRDYEAVYAERARLMVEEDTPELPFPDPDTLAKERLYNEQALQPVYEEWVRQREAFLTMMEGLDEAAWVRSGNHPRRGPMSVQDQLALVVWHDMNHVEQMTRILVEKQGG